MIGNFWHETDWIDFYYKFLHSWVFMTPFDWHKPYIQKIIINYFKYYIFIFHCTCFFFVRYYKWKQLNIFHLYTLNKIKSTRKLLNNIMKIWINFKSIRWVLAIKMYKNIKINGIQLNKLIPEASKINCSQIMIKNGCWCKKMQKCFENTFFFILYWKDDKFFFWI